MKKNNTKQADVSRTELVSQKYKSPVKRDN